MRRSQVFAGLLLSAMAATAAAQGAARKPYIVQLHDAPVASYAGGVPGYTATRPATGAKLNVNASDVQAYTAYLDRKQRAVIATAVPAAMVTYRYKNLMNGFAAFLTDAEFAKLVHDPAVRSISEDVPMKINTATTPGFLGLTGPGGVWARTDASGRALKGENIIIGHLDGGVWPENPSFSDKVDANGKPIASHLPGTVVYDPLPAGRWNGICQAGEGFNASHCNNKLIGARYFNATWKLAVSLGLTTTWSREYLDSPRDPDGHGTHTLSTAGGNENVTAVVNGSEFVISGVAPRARVAAYKVCYTPADANDNPQQGGCYPSDSAAAADQAVADGVDVINFSVGGSRTSVQGVVDTAFANATFAGVFVAASAGNSGPTASTVAHVNPWVMTVGNSTHDRFTVARVTLGDGGASSGPSFQTGGVPSTPLILATDAGVNAFSTLSDADKLALGRCYNAADRAALGGSAASVLDPAKVAGKIVVCFRGGNALVNKTQEVKDKGGAAVIIQNLPAGLLPAPFAGGSANTTLNIAHVVPTVHLPASGASAVINHASTSGATASFGPGVQVAGVVAPVMNDGSSRGPQQRDPNLLKPDITGPGTDIIAAYTNTSITPAQRLEIIAGTLIPGPGASMISGTSMSSPHVAGAAALVKQAKPGWSPYAIKSALMTSASQTVRLANGSPDLNPFGQGAGHLNVAAALDTTAVYDQSTGDHIDYYFGAIDGRQINIASMTAGSMVGVTSFSRTITNKSSSAVTFNGAASLAGFNVVLSPSTLNIAPGASASYTATITRTTATFGSYVAGEVVWTGGGQRLRSPLTARPLAMTAVSNVSDTRNVGTKVYTVGFGYSGALLTRATGLVPAATRQARIATNAEQCYTFPVAAGARILRAQLFNSETEGGAASDLDLDVRLGTESVGASFAGDSEETVSVSNPAAGNYEVCVQGFAPLNGIAAYRLSVFVVGPTHPGTLRAFAPTAVVAGGVASIGVSWNVPANARYLGVVDYRQTSTGAPIGSTTVSVVNNPGGAPNVASAVVLREKDAPIR
jgi:subtilisin family serine protease